MAYTNVYPNRINWENEPSINTPINETNLNKMDYALYQHDRTLENWDTTKANQSDLLLSVKTIDYDTETGVFVFTWQNGTTKTVDLNIEKIPVNFSMSPQGVITMTTDDGTTYTADVGALIKTYTFNDSSVIDFTVVTDASGNKTITADIVDGSITGTKLQPNYLADCTAAKTAAENAETGAEDSAEDAEAWAVGERNGVPVDPSDPTYHNNSKYWSQQANPTTLEGLTDTDINDPEDGQVLTFNGVSEKWENADPAAGGGSKVEVSTSEVSLIGTTATLTDGTITLSAEFDAGGKATFTGVTMTGDLTLTATDGVDTITRTISIPYFGNYSVVVAFFSATVNVTFPFSSGATCILSDGVTTLNATASPMAFNVPNAGTWTATVTLDGVSKQNSATITTDGQTESITIEYGTINLTFDDDFRGQTVTCVNGGTTITKVAPSSGNTMTFYPPTTGTWDISSTISGTPYYTSAEVTSLSTPASATLQKNVTATVTLHGAAGAIIAYTDADGSHTQTLDNNGEKANVTIAVNPETPNVVFEDTTKAKNLSDLTSNYKKTVTITSNLTDIYVMKKNSLYWHGYKNDNIGDAKTLGYSSTGGNTYGNAEENINSVSLAVTNAVTKGYGINNAIDFTNIKNVKALASYVQTGSSPQYYGALIGVFSTKVDNSVITYSELNAYYPLGIRKVDASGITGNNYIQYWAYNTGNATLDALWYESEGDYNFYSAADDVVTYKDANNNDVVFAVTDENGGAYIDYSAIPNGTYTFKSSKAKNPDDLSQYYSKTVSITNATTEVKVMPDNALYWYGYIGNAEDCISANGWSYGIVSHTLTAPTHNTNSIYFETSASNVGKAYGASTPITGKVSAIIEAVNVSSSESVAFFENTTKVVKNNWTGATTGITNTSPTKYSRDVTNSYPYVEVYGTGRSANLYALWYE